MFEDIRKLEDREIKEGERWIYSAGFNVKPDLKDTERIDEELDDLEQLITSGTRVVILSHQGRFTDGDVLHLDYVKRYLRKKLGREVKYFQENNTPAAITFARSLKPRQVTIMENTRFHEGEEENCQELARQFAQLGDFVAIGGFNKSHHPASSNVGILKYLPGFLARSIIRNIQLLVPWTGKSNCYSIAILGGRKKEKVSALEGFSEIYDVIIPGGIVLNTILKVKGYEIGSSVIKEKSNSFEAIAERVLSRHKDKIYIPQRVCIANIENLRDSKWIDISEKVPQGYMIVDFELTDSAFKALDLVVEQKGRILLAGTPALYTKGFTQATLQLLPYLENPRTKSIILGGDSTREIPASEHVVKSTGGGSSLEFLCKGTSGLAVYEALKINKQKFPDV